MITKYYKVFKMLYDDAGYLEKISYHQALWCLVIAVVLECVWFEFGLVLLLLYMGWYGPIVYRASQAALLDARLDNEEREQDQAAAELDRLGEQRQRDLVTFGSLRSVIAQERWGGVYGVLSRIKHPEIRQQADQYVWDQYMDTYKGCAWRWRCAGCEVEYPCTIGWGDNPFWNETPCMFCGHHGGMHTGPHDDGVKPLIDMRWHIRSEIRRKEGKGQKYSPLWRDMKEELKALDVQIGNYGKKQRRTDNET